MTSDDRKHLQYIFLSVAILILSAYTGCTNKKSISGKQVIPRDTFIEVLIDIHLVDGITNDVRYYRFFNPGDSIDMYGPIFDKHGVSREKFDLTMHEYSEHPALLDMVYDDVLMKLNMMKDDLGVEKVEPEKKSTVRQERKPRLKVNEKQVREKN